MVGKCTRMIGRFFPSKCCYSKMDIAHVCAFFLFTSYPPKKLLQYFFQNLRDLFLAIEVLLSSSSITHWQTNVSFFLLSTRNTTSNCYKPIGTTIKTIREVLNAPYSACSFRNGAICCWYSCK